jgi:hypothetical protein
MVDIRLVRPRGGRIWVWTGTLAALALAALLLSMVFGDPTALRRTRNRMAVFPTERAPVTPLRAVSFETVRPLEDRALGRLLHLSGTVQSDLVRGAVWVRSNGGRRLLVRFDPPPPAGALRGIYPGGPMEVDGYLTKIARAEFETWTRALGVVIPRPEPGVKFGDLPDSNFVRVDSLFVRDFYLSVRPDGIGAHPSAPPPPIEHPAAARPAPPIALPVVPAETAADTSIVPPPPDTGGVR